MLLWYSQEARAYALLVLLTALALLYFLRALARTAGGQGADRGTSGACSGGSSRLWRWRPTTSPSSRSPPRRSGCCAGDGGGRRCPGSRSSPSPACVGAAGDPPDVDRARRMDRRATASATGSGRPGSPSWSARPETSSPGPSTRCSPCCRLLLVAAALVLLRCAGSGDERRGAGMPLAIAAATVAVPIVLGAARSGKDYVLARNLMPALVPLLVAVGVGCTLPRARAGWGCCSVPAVAVYSLGFCVWASVSPALQRPDWDAVAAEPGRTGRAARDGHLDARRGIAALYLSTGAFQVAATDGYGWRWARSTSSPAARRPRRRATARPAFPPGRLRTCRSAASTCVRYEVARGRVGATAIAAVRGAPAWLPLQRGTARRNRGSVTRDWASSELS